MNRSALDSQPVSVKEQIDLLREASIPNADRAITAVVSQVKKNPTNLDAESIAGLHRIILQHPDSKVRSLAIARLPEILAPRIWERPGLKLAPTLAVLREAETTEALERRPLVLQSEAALVYTALESGTLTPGTLRSFCARLGKVMGANPDPETAAWAVGCLGSMLTRAVNWKALQPAAEALAVKLEKLIEDESCPEGARALCVFYLAPAPERTSAVECAETLVCLRQIGEKTSSAEVLKQVFAELVRCFNIKGYGLLEELPRTERQKLLKFARSCAKHETEYVRKCAAAICAQDRN